MCIAHNKQKSSEVVVAKQMSYIHTVEEQHQGCTCHISNSGQWSAVSGQLHLSSRTRNYTAAVAKHGAREDHLQAGHHGVPLPAWSGTSVPRRPSHSSL